jgi:hypothetical protein
MAAPVVVPSVPWMPERAWTTCVSNGAISGLARANYVPFAPQPLPPGMSEAEYEALDPSAGGPGFGVPPPDDCFPRYVMWRESLRNPDFLGGQLGIQWSRQPGWDFRNDCVPAACDMFYGEGQEPFYADAWPDGSIFYAGMVEGTIIGPLAWEWRIWEPTGTVPTSEASPIWIRTDQNTEVTDAEFTTAFAADYGPFCNGEWKVRVTDLGNPTCFLDYYGTWSYACF